LRFGKDGNTLGIEVTIKCLDGNSEGDLLGGSEEDLLGDSEGDLLGDSEGGMLGDSEGDLLGVPVKDVDPLGEPRRNTVGAAVLGNILWTLDCNTLGGVLEDAVVTLDGDMLLRKVLGAPVGTVESIFDGSGVERTTVGVPVGFLMGACVSHEKFSGASLLLSHTVSVIQSYALEIRLCTPGRWAQPTPQLTTPTWMSSSGLFPWTIRGPPESPWLKMIKTCVRCERF